MESTSLPNRAMSAPTTVADEQQRSSAKTKKPLPSENLDFQETLRALVSKREEAHIKSRTLGVVFSDLEVVGLDASNRYQPTLGSLFNYKTIQASISAARYPPVRKILSGFEGVVKPGEMLLVLGRPGSGCTTFLKTIANRREEYYAVNGEVHYDCLSPEDIKNHYRGDIQYCPEDDIHFPALSVEHTLKFAAKTRAPKMRMGVSRSVYNNQITDGLLTLFGLRHARKTPVGDAMIRGISGGEKKRVSIAEVFATRPCFSAWDNSTRGLDSSTALEYVRALRIATDTLQSTTIVSLYQAGENLYRQFDKVCVIYEGKMAYFGPVDQAKQYFTDMGYEPANRQTTSDFLVSVTDPNGRIVRPGVMSLPRTAGEFAKYFKKSSFGIANRNEIDDYTLQLVGKPDGALAYKESSQAEHSKYTRPTSPYMISIPMQIRAVMLRQVQILRGNMFAVGLNAFAILFASFMTMAEIPALYAQRPIVHRHKIAALYHPFIEALALTLVDIPITFVTTLLYAIILYFMIGLQRTAGQFFIFYLFMFSMLITMKAWFRTVAAAFKSEAPAQTLAGLSVFAFALYTGSLCRYPIVATWTILIRYKGFQIPKPSMIGALRWITFLNNFGILMTFVVGIVGLLLLFSELNTSMVYESPVVLFKQGSKSTVQAAETDDEEALRKEQPLPVLNSSTIDAQKKIAEAAVMSDIFSWQHINYTVPISDEEDRKLLSDVTGYVVPGKLTGLMGESGAGKTTLLNVLAQRVSFGVVTGDRFVNGQALPKDFQSQTHDSGYCQQMDTHLPTTTIREALLFSAQLRQPAEVPVQEKEAYVEECLKMCGLDAYGDAVVGSLGVEHRKRTTIAVELAAKPKLLLFLDEPTSGLDSQSYLVHAFDRLLLLQKGGQTVYFGDLGKNTSTLINYFERNGSRACHPDENPAEFMLDVIGAGATASSELDWHDIWLKSEESKRIQIEINNIHKEGRNRPPAEAILHHEFATNWFYQVGLLLKRNAQAYWRDPTYLMAKLVLNIFSGIFIGFTFWRQKNSQQGTQNKLFVQIFFAS
ncbi:hypothetical protein C0995_002576 [Termitomyces sp. Mi166|nr:hypothetical protein C0995_002576 [Termitomyces sp. Mi166\